MVTNLSEQKSSISIVLMVLCLIIGCHQNHSELETRHPETQASTQPMSAFQSLDVRRMFREQLPSSNIYRAIWDTRTDPVYVELLEWSLALSGRRFTVNLLSPQGKLLQTGILECDANRIPYCLVEIRTDCPELPTDYRDRWILGVALSSESRPLNPAKPLRWSTHFGYDPHDEDYNYLGVEPVKWGKDEEKFRYGYNFLIWCDKSPEIRFAERAMSKAKLID